MGFDADAVVVVGVRIDPHKLLEFRTINKHNIPGSCKCPIPVGKTYKFCPECGYDFRIKTWKETNVYLKGTDKLLLADTNYEEINREVDVINADISIQGYAIFREENHVYSTNHCYIVLEMRSRVIKRGYDPNTIGFIPINRALEEDKLTVRKKLVESDILTEQEFDESFGAYVTMTASE